MTDEVHHDEAPQETASQEIGETGSDGNADEAAAPAAPDDAPAGKTSGSDSSDAESASEESYDFEIPVTPELDAALASERGQSSKPTSTEGKSADEAPSELPQQKLRIIIDVRTPEPVKPAEKPTSGETEREKMNGALPSRAAAGRRKARVD